LTPATFPSVQLPTEVAPEDEVVGALVSVPPPAVTLSVIGTPLSALPLPSFTVNVGDVASGNPAVAVDTDMSAAIEAGTAGSVPFEQPAIAVATTTVDSRRKRGFIVGNNIRRMDR
jgi:hypothetical protein